MVRVDLHTHSRYSPDGGLTLADYRRVLDGRLDYVAVTDHNSVAGALKLHAALGDRIIVGSEISTLNGELIGLYLQRDVAPGQSLAATIKQIRAQGGLVLVPHPYERWQRFSLYPSRHPDMLDQLDIIETYNSRSLSVAGRLRAKRLARRLDKPQAAGSDAHGPAGIGRAYTVIAQAPTRQNLLAQLRRGRLVSGRTGLKGYLEPSRNRRARRASISANSKGKG